MCTGKLSKLAVHTHVAAFQHLSTVEESRQPKKAPCTRYELASSSLLQSEGLPAALEQREAVNVLLVAVVCTVV